MKIVSRIPEMSSITTGWRQSAHSIAFVPTMGNLHQGHLSLVNLAKQHASHVVVSIFVNPLQFGPKEDFNQYPRTLEADVQMLQAMGTDVLFTPHESAIYPLGLTQQTQVIVPTLGERLCGASRPGHFNGVTTIVNKLFNIVQPDIAVFGQKDFQQLAIIQKMVSDLCIPIKIVRGETIRELDGLAMSSRNNYLTASERNIAPTLYQILQHAKQQTLSGNSTYAEICTNAQQDLLQAGFKPDYFEICNAQNLLAASQDDQDIVILAAAYLGKTRLIDNIYFLR